MLLTQQQFGRWAGSGTGPGQWDPDWQQMDRMAKQRLTNQRAIRNTRHATRRFSPGCRGWTLDAAVTRTSRIHRTSSGGRKRRRGSGMQYVWERAKVEATTRLSIGTARASRGCKHPSTACPCGEVRRAGWVEKTGPSLATGCSI